MISCIRSGFISSFNSPFGAAPAQLLETQPALLPNSGRTEVAQIWPNLGRTRPRRGRHKPNAIDSGTCVPEILPISTHIDQFGLKLGRPRPTSTNLRPCRSDICSGSHSAHNGPTATRLRPKSGPNPTNSGPNIFQTSATRGGEALIILERLLTSVVEHIVWYRPVWSVVQPYNFK